MEPVDFTEKMIPNFFNIFNHKKQNNSLERPPQSRGQSDRGHLLLMRLFRIRHERLPEPGLGRNPSVPIGRWQG
jgi:hypothetical protein